MDEHTAAAILEGLNEDRLNQREILAFIGTPKTLCYFEGHSPVVYLKEGGSGWFCFNAGFNEGWLELMRLGFTPDEIKAARRRY